MLTVLVFLEWPTICLGDTFDLSRVCFTMPSAIRFLDDAPPPTSMASSGILSWAAAICESCKSCDSWLEPWALPVPGLNLPPLVGGVNTGSASFVELVPCELVRERARWCRWCNWGAPLSLAAMCDSEGIGVE
jgi:hypothetical protein